LHFEWRLFWLDKSSLPRPDIIIVSSLSLLTVLNGLLLRFKFKCKLIFEVRDIWPLTIIEYGGFSEKNPLIRFLGWLEQLGYRNADQIVGTMPNLGQRVRNVLGHEKPTYCIPMVVMPEAGNHAQASLPEGYEEKNIPSGKFITAYAGTIGLANALDIFFKCAERLIYNSKIHFLVLGDGSLRDHFIQRYGQLPNLTFAPRVEKNQVQSVLKRCDLLYFSVYPSKVWDYGQSLNKVIDYMLSGKPILASYSGFPSMIDEAGCGRFIEAGNLEQLTVEVERFSQLPLEQRIAMGQRGRQWILNNRGYKKLAAEYMELIFQ
jgi:glycosyltransferase involved in cell wall biosynthesis